MKITSMKKLTGAGKILSQKAVLSSMLCLIAFIGFSQEKSIKNKWKYFLEPYVMFPNMSGTTGIGELPAVSVDADPGDIFSHLQMGLMIYAEAGNDKWAITNDILYMNLKQDVKSGLVIQSGKINAKQLGWELAGFYKICRYFDAGVGVRLNSLNTEVNIVQNNIGGGTTNRNKSLTETWIDPFIVTRMHSNDEQKFIWQLRTDIGGFGIGSKLAWQIQAYAGYRFSRLFQLTGGYRIISMDYDKGNGSDKFLYDINTFGPVIRFGFNL
jgi:hypothetical protein